MPKLEVLSINFQTNFEKVREFHEKFNCAIGKRPCLNVQSLREKLIREEFREVMEAFEQNDIKKIAKEMCDLLYVLYGAGVTFGLDMDKCFEAVHASNMSKLGRDGQPIIREDGKILKGPGYYEPDMEKAVFGG